MFILPTCCQGIDTLAGGTLVYFTVQVSSEGSVTHVTMHLLQVVSQESLPQFSSSQGRVGNFMTRLGIDPGSSRVISESSTIDTLDKLTHTYT